MSRERGVGPGDDRLQAHYASELALLRETAAAFAAIHPAHAGALQEPGEDPDVERLLEGVAFLTAGLRARIDHASEQVAHDLAALTLPHLLRSLPAATVVELTPGAPQDEGPHEGPDGRPTRPRIAPGFPLGARVVDGTSCRFSTAWEVELWPLTVLQTTLDAAGSDRPRIRLELAVTAADGDALAIPGPLRLFLHHADPALPATLLLWLREHLAGITVTAAGAPPIGERIGKIEKIEKIAQVLPPEAVTGLSPTTHGIFPWPSTAPVGYRALLELLALPEGLCFVELQGFGGPTLANASTITVEFTFDRPPPLPATIGPGTLRLHCTPAINLFAAPGEPIAWTPLTSEAIVRAEGVDPRHMEVVEVTAVRAGGRRGGAPWSFPPFTAAVSSGVSGTAGASTIGTPSFALRRARSAIDCGVDTYLRLVDPPGSRALHDELLSLDLLCTNRALAGELRQGDLFAKRATGAAGGATGAAGSPVGAATNLTAVTPPVELPLGPPALWQLLAHLAHNHRGPEDAAALRELLGLYDPYPREPREGPRGAQGRPRGSLGQTNARLIAAIREVTHRPVIRLIRGVPVRALETTVEVDARGFAGPGRAYLFGATLAELFASLSQINAASEVRLVLFPSRQEFRWPLRIGV